MLKKSFFLFLFLCVTIPGTATIRYVDSAATGNNTGISWANAYTMLSAALTEAAGNTAIDSILVATGTYYPTGIQSGTNRDSAFLITRGGIKIYGGYPRGGGTRNISANTTYLDGNTGSANSLANDNSYHVMLIAGISADSVVIDGFSIRNGEADGGNFTYYNGQQVAQYNGGGIYVSGGHNGGGTAIRNCRFSLNYDATAGGGIFNDECGPFITNCTFLANSGNSGNGICNNVSTATITNCTFLTNGTASGSDILNDGGASTIINCIFSNGHAGIYGGAVRNTADSSIFINCSFFGNTAVSGGAMSIELYSSIRLTGCIFASNTATDGGGIFNRGARAVLTNCYFEGNSAAIDGGGVGNFHQASDSFINCTFVGNTASLGGGINSNFDTSAIINCTFAGNSASSGGGIYISTLSIDKITNSIIYGNGDNLFDANLPGISIITYSLIQGDTSTANGNISGNTDPLFVNANDPIGPDGKWGTADDGLELSACSPVVNIGNNSANTTATDATGQTRIFDNTIDLGAYELQVLPGFPVRDTIARTICGNDSALFNGVYYRTTGYYADTLQRVFGCDSIVTLNLTVKNYSTHTIDTTVCFGQTYMFNGASYSTSQTVVGVFTNTGGCDSIVTVHLTVRSLLAATQNIAICPGQLPYSWNGHLVTAGGTTSATYTTPSLVTGCDSITTLNLTVNPVITVVQPVSICTSQLPYSWNGNTITTGGAAVATFTTSSLITGCDSTTTLNLTVNPPLVATENKTICSSMLPYSWNGTMITAAGTAVATFTTSSLITGCDSTTTLNLAVSPSAYTLSIDTAACSALVFDGQAYTGSTQVQDVLRNIYGCDSVYRTIQITIYPGNPSQQIIDTFTCSNSLMYESQIYARDTVLHEILHTIHGCDSINRTVNIVVENFKLNLTMDPADPYQYEPVVFTTASNIEDYSIYAWTPAAWFSNQVLHTQEIVATTGNTVTVTGKSYNGCIDSASITFNTAPLQYDIFVPNAFTPNGDGKNDYFETRFFIARAYTIDMFNVYNRWGQLVYSGSGNAARWNGMHDGVQADMGTYNYLIKVKFIDGHIEQLKGAVELIR